MGPWWTCQVLAIITENCRNSHNGVRGDLTLLENCCTFVFAPFSALRGTLLCHIEFNFRGRTLYNA